MKKQTKNIIAGVVMVVVGLLSGYLARNAFQKGIDMIGYAVPKNEIAPYTVLSAEMFTSRELPRALAATGAEYCADIRQLEGRMTTSRLIADLPVACAVLSESQDYRLADPSLEVVSFPVPAENAVGGEIESGANINIYLVRTYATEGSNSVNRSDLTLIATVPVIKMIPVSPVLDEEDLSSSSKSISIVVAGPAQTVQNILGAVTKAEGDPNTYIWTTLAAAESSALNVDTTYTIDLSQTAQGLGVTQSGARSALEGLGLVFGAPQYDSEGTLFQTGSRDTLVNAILYGPEENLTKVEVKVSATGAGVEAMDNSVYLVGFVKYLFPEWSGGAEWIKNQFAVSVAGSGAETTYGGANISLSERDTEGNITMMVIR